MSFIDEQLTLYKKKYSLKNIRWMMKNKPLSIFSAVLIILSVVIVVWGWYAYGPSRGFNSLVLLSITIVFVPITIAQYLEYTRIEQMEVFFPNFLRDISDSRRAGITLPDAIRNASGTYYAALSPEVKKMSDQLSWGVPFETVLRKFAQRVQSNLIRRDIEMILEAYRAGGSIADILDAVTADTMKIKELQQETRSTLRIQVNTVYILYFTFIGIIIMLQNVLLPSLPALSGITQIVGSAGSTIPPSEFSLYLLHFVFIQGFFIGMIAGEVSEGSLKAGMKHSLFLMIMGFAIMQVFIKPPSLESRLINSLSTLPLELSINTSLGEFEVEESVSIFNLVDKLNELGRKEEAKRRLAKVTYDDIRFSQNANCVNCSEDVVYVSKDGTELIVLEATTVTVEISAIRGTIKLFIG